MPSLTPIFQSDTLPYTRHQIFQREGITQHARGLPTHAPTLERVSDLIEGSENIGKGRSAPNMTNLPIWIVEKLPAQISPRRAAHYRPSLTRLISVLLAMGGPTHANMDFNQPNGLQLRPKRTLPAETDRKSTRFRLQTPEALYLTSVVRFLLAYICVLAFG